MELILNSLTESFSDVCINQQKSPSYVNCHWEKSESNIIHVYRKGHNSSYLTPKKRDHTTLISEFDLTGSPLKLDMAYDKLEETFLLDISNCWFRDEINHEPLTVEEARNIINYYNTKIRKMNQEDRLPMWIVCDGQDQNSTLLMTALSYGGYFNRGIVNFLETTTASELSIDNMKNIHWNTYGCSPEQPMTCKVNASFRITGKRAKAVMQDNPDEVFNKHYNGMTQLECDWTNQTLQVPLHEASIKLIQEAIIGHDLSGGTILWKSVCALQGISSTLLSISSTVMPSKLDEITIRPFSSPWQLLSQEVLENRLRGLLSNVEEYGSLSQGPKGGCICVADDTTSLQQVFTLLENAGSSNDFTYQLWDILKDVGDLNNTKCEVPSGTINLYKIITEEFMHCEQNTVNQLDCDTVENLITLLVYALKDVYKRNLRPFIDPGNTTILGALVKKLARGSSLQAVNSLATLFSNPSRALNIIGQLGIAKTCWEFTNIFSLVDNTLGFNDRLRLQNKVSEVNEEVFNQTIMDMTLGTGDMSINPFDSKVNLMDSTFMQEPEQSASHPLADLTLDNFKSLKKHNIEVKTEKRLCEKDQPLFSDEMDVEMTSKEWKFKLTRLAQLQTCLEHVNRAQQSLSADFNTLKPIIAQLLEFYTADDSPIKTVGQLRNEPVQTFQVPLQYKTVKEHLQFKHASQYKITFTSQSFNEATNGETKTPYQTIQSTFVCSQQPVFPPNIFISREVPEDSESLYFHCTKYLYLSNTL